MHKTSINDLDTCAEECMKDSKCFGFDFGKKDRNNKCLHSTRNTQRIKRNENYDSWLKVCYYESGNAGKTNFDLMLPPFFEKNLTIKRRSLNHITSSFSKMVSPSDLILSDHVTISLLPFKFC